LAKQIWQDIWSVSGATPENCLYTFVELFIFKYLSDLEILQGIYNFDTLVNSFETNSAKEILENYAGVIRPKIKELFPMNPVDKTTIINGTIFVSKDQKAVTGYSTVFKKILLKFRDYGKLENIDYDFKSKLFESFLKESISKKNWGQFFTPLKVVRAIIEMAKDNIKDGISICDPACGVGKFLLEPLVTRLEYLYDINGNAKKDEDKIKPKITIHGFDKGFDKDEQKTIILAKANMLIYFSDMIRENVGLTKQFAKIFNDSFTLKTNSILGTLSDAITEQYDLILTNPPYVTSGSSNLKEEIRKDGELVNHYKVNALGVEGLFMEWIIKALKPNGKAFVVIPDGMLNRQNDKNLRKYILDECFIDGLISLPLNTFFTTNKKTYILCLTKKADKKQIQTEPVFTYLVSEIGETRDVYRFDIDQNDLNEAVTLFSFFKGNKSRFAKINVDKRCKIVSSDYFQSNIDKNWVVDKCWTEKEKIELGIIEESKSISLFEFSSILEDVANTIIALKEEVQEISEKKNSNVTLKYYKVKDLFKIERGSGKYIKRYINANPGDYPVFSGNTAGAFSFINSFDYDTPCLSWVIDGFAGFMMIHDKKFSATNHRGVLIPKNENINLFYAKARLEPLFRVNKKGRYGLNGSDEYTALPPFLVEDIEIPMPINQNGDIDVSVQAEVAKRYELAGDIKAKIDEYQKKIDNLNVELENYEHIVNLTMENIFDLTIKTNGSSLTKSFVEKNKGNIPVYSASKFPESVDYGYIKDNLKNVKYFSDCLTWNIDGSVGKLHYRKGKFSLSEKVIPLVLLPKYKNKIDINYLKYIIEKEFSIISFSFNNKAGKGKIRHIEIPIPVGKNGDFDLSTQKEIAEKHQKIEQIKKDISEKLGKISNTVIELI
jgi:type I restriction-modification system DNA methylase subunit